MADPAAPTAADIQALTRALVDMNANMAAANTARAQAAAPTINANVPQPLQVQNRKAGLIQKPKDFDGSRDQTRGFLNSFIVWANNQEESMNDANGKKDEEWIITFLSFCKGKAAVWASNHQADYVARSGHFVTPNWTAFVDDFKRHFEALDEAQYARDVIADLKQEGMSVDEYVSKFKEYMGRTGLSKVDLRERLYDNLSEEVKDYLANTDRKHQDFDDLVTVATEIDHRHRRRAAEKKGKRVNRLHSAAQVPQLVPTPVADPMAMDVDATVAATRTVTDYITFMRGKCYGCGSKDHQKKDGGHERDVCAHCGLVGHRANVCRKKFFGKPGRSASTFPPARVRATAEESAASVASTSTASTSSAPAQTPSADIATINAAIAAMMQTQQTMMAEIKAMREAGF